MPRSKLSIRNSLGCFKSLLDASQTRVQSVPLQNVSAGVPHVEFTDNVVRGKVPMSVDAAKHGVLNGQF